MNVEGFPEFQKKLQLKSSGLISWGNNKIDMIELNVSGGKGLHLEEISHVEC
jgi:hypothetical protein